jgi:tripartite-type tricarboxylate transporter receptor subunit TctC
MSRAVPRSITFAFVAAILLSATPTHAQSPAEFYRGKTLRMLIGYGPGGGYDLYGRLVTEFLPRHIPGNPMMVPQNMPGAGSFVAAKYMAEVAPKDGTVFGSLSQTLALDSMIGTVMYPTALNIFAGSKFKIVKGYSGTTDIQLAMERGEVDILPAYGLPGILVSQPGWINKGEAVFLYQAALKRHRLLPNAPTLPELALDDEGRAVLHAIASTAEIGRSINTTPGVPAERLAVLRTAFQAMLKDPEFVAASEKRNLMIDGATGEEMDEIVRETLKIPASVLAKVGQVSN